MNVVCSMLGHKRTATKSWDGEFYHSSCSRCDAALVRLSGDKTWREPDETERRYFEKMKDAHPAHADTGDGSIPRESLQSQ